MAEKEERIGITKFEETETPDFELCAYHLMTRSEAIERMAKAICKRDMFGCERCDYGKNKEKCEAWVALTYMNNAEAALNALLEGKDA